MHSANVVPLAHRGYMYRSSLHEAVIARAHALLLERRIEEAIRAFKCADRLASDPVKCAAGLWTCYMLMGRFELAWRQCERIESLGRRDNYTLWDGRPIDGSRILVRAIHGLGDTIQFIRYASLLKDRRARVIVQTHPEIVEIVRTVEGVDSAITWPDSTNLRAMVDREIEIMELPRVFGTTTATVPDAIPYIWADQVRLKMAADRLGPKLRPRVGLVWAASDYNRARNVPTRALTPIAESRKYELFSFQRGPQIDDLHKIPEFGNTIQIDSSAGSLETAAFMLQMDLLLTVDTFAAHLAGALGRPAFVMLPFCADWRWMLNRRDSPWYPTMRLFRQPAPGCWEPVIRQVVCELDRMF